MKTFFYNHKSGFSMVEVALALGIVGIAITAILGVFPYLLQGSRTAIESTEVALLAQNSIEADYGSTLMPDAGGGGTQYIPLPGPATSMVSTSASGSLMASNYVIYSPAIFSTNGTATNGFSYYGTNFLVTAKVIFAWPHNAKLKTRYTFVTEIAATSNIVVHP